MIRIGICSDDCEIVPVVEDYLKTRNCWYELHELEGELPEVFSYLEQNPLELLFLDAFSRERMEAARVIGRRLKGVRVVLLVEEEKELEREDLEDIFFVARKESLKEQMPDILDQYYIMQRYLKRERLLVNSKSRQIVLELKDVLYLERDRRSSTFICANGEKLTSPQDLSVIQELIGRDDFVRCHNSYMVNLNYVKEFCRSEFVLKTGQEIPISRRYLEEVRRRMKRWAESIW